MAVDPGQIARAVEARLPDARELLADLIAIPSLSGHESAAMECAERAFAKISEVRRVPLSNALRDDPDYSDPITGIDYDGRWNLRAARVGNGKGKTLLLNTHIDTVPPAQGQADPFNPIVRDGVMFGRGACDAKGQAATIYLALAALNDLAVNLAGNVIAHLVVEEENGGNGTLAMARASTSDFGFRISDLNNGGPRSSQSAIRNPQSAIACVVLEPTDLKVLPSIRGAVWFRIALTGRAGHSGQAAVSRSALKMAIRVVEILEGYHARLLAASRGLAMFDKFANPMPLTVGQLHAGNWPATAPAEAFIEGVLGLLPNKTARQVMAEVAAAIRDEGGPELADNVKVHFSYRHDSSVCPADHPLVTTLTDVLSAVGRLGVIDAMTASCDAWLYNNQLAIPTVVFGGGSLGVAHSAAEQMPLADLAAAATAIATLASRWCGSETK